MNTETELLAVQRRLMQQVNAEADRLQKHQIQTAQFVRNSLLFLAVAHSRAALLGVEAADGGTLVNTAAVALDTAALVVREQEHFVKALSEDIDAGRYKAKADGGQGDAGRRLRFLLYAKRLVGTANRAWAQAVGAQTPVYWVTTTGESCPTCLYENKQGWRAVERLTRFPADGTTLCLTNCKCYLITRKGLTSLRVLPL
jgi:hypothetical protein